MIEIPDAKTIVESQLLETLADVRQQIASGMNVDFKEPYVSLPDRDVSYPGEAVVQLLGAYPKVTKIAVLAWVTHLDFPEEAMEELSNKLAQRLCEELNNRIPDLKWFNVEIHLLDSIEDREEPLIQQF
jgi:hypothetical protein